MSVEHQPCLFLLGGAWQSLIMVEYFTFLIFMFHPHPRNFQLSSFSPVTGWPLLSPKLYNISCELKLPMILLESNNLKMFYFKAVLASYISKQSFKKNQYTLSV